MELSEIHQKLEHRKEELETALSADVLFIPYENQGRIRVEASSRKFRKNKYSFVSSDTVETLIEKRGFSESQLFDMILDQLKVTFKELME